MLLIKEKNFTRFFAQFVCRSLWDHVTYAMYYIKLEKFIIRENEPLVTILVFQQSFSFMWKVLDLGKLKKIISFPSKTDVVQTISINKEVKSL